jgi:hypothetical protein
MSDWSDYTDAAADLDAASTDLTAAAGNVADAQWSAAQGDGWADWSSDSLGSDDELRNHPHGRTAPAGAGRGEARLDARSAAASV